MKEHKPDRQEHPSPKKEKQQVENKPATKKETHQVENKPATKKAQKLNKEHAGIKILKAKKKSTVKEKSNQIWVPGKSNLLKVKVQSDATYFRRVTWF